ncbi:MAG: Mur ligase domain-containing protein, partial [Deltaproteobacteria bacterium]|nr:Mur ligase domain-containing protein [Deltaproteobacteria bacterium]
MLLEHLIQDFATLQVHGRLQRQVRALTYHSGQASEESLFVAIKGTQSDGHEFVHQAIDRGAQTIVVEKPQEPISGITVIRVANSRAALAHIASRFYGFPSH